MWHRDHRTTFVDAFWRSWNEWTKSLWRCCRRVMHTALSTLSGVSIFTWLFLFEYIVRCVHFYLAVPVFHSYNTTAPEYLVRNSRGSRRQYQAFVAIVTKPLVGMSGIAIGMSVCLFAHISQKPHGSRFHQIIHTLPVAVAQFFSDNSAIRYVLPVLWTTSYFHIIEWMRQNQDRRGFFIQFASGGTGGKVCYLRLRLTACRFGMRLR